MKKVGTPENVEQTLKRLRTSVERTSKPYQEYLAFKGYIDRVAGSIRLSPTVIIKSVDELKTMVENVEQEQNF